MENFTLHNEAILRIPILPFSFYTLQNIRKYLGQDFIKAALLTASPDLYKELDKRRFVFDELPPKLQASVSKYFNRMSSRSTPFGLFSSVSVTGWEETATVYNIPRISGIFFRGVQDIRAAIDKYHSVRFSSEKYYPSGMHYNSIVNQIRLLSAGDEPDNCQVIAIDNPAFVKKVVAYCRKGKTRKELIDFFTSGMGFDDHDADETIGSLYEAGLLISDTTPNISGSAFAAEIAHKLRQPLTEFKVYSDHTSSGMPKNGSQLLRSVKTSSANGNIYACTLRTTDGKLPADLKSGLERAVLLAAGLVDEKVSDPMAAFKTAFAKKYDGMHVPLLRALDPELGIAYHSEAETNELELLEGLKLKSSRGKDERKSSTEHYLFKKLVGCKPGENIILNEKRFLTKSISKKLPPSISLLFRSDGENILLEEAGSSSAVALAGRFSTFSDEVKKYCHSIAEFEQSVNSGVIFADLSFLTGDKTDNINLRENIRKYEICCMTRSCLPLSRQILLSDLHLFMVRGELLLYSKRLKKRIIPRLDSAYNHTRSKNPVVRFLCDLQYQGLITSFVPDMSRLFPGLDYYPALVCKNITLGRPKWVISPEKIANIKTSETPLILFEQWARSNNLPERFTLAQGDNELFFDRSDKWSMDLFFNSVSDGSSCVLKSFFDSGRMVKDRTGNSYQTQGLTAMLNKSRVYTPMTQLRKTPASIRRNFLPAEQWLYIKMACHSEFSNTLITDFIQPVIIKLRRQKILDKWFFIRYSDPEDHIRLRIKVPQTYIPVVINGINKEARKYVDSGLIGDFSVETYRRELERYGTDVIENVEKAFQCSSEMAICLLKHNERIADRHSYVRVIAEVLAISAVFFGDVSERKEFFSNYHLSMLSEFQFDSSLKLAMDRKVREFNCVFRELESRNLIADGLQGSLFQDTLITLKDQLKDDRERLCRMCGDMIHMHLNRLFHKNQRKQEMIICFLIFRYLTSLIARSCGDLALFTTGPKTFGGNVFNESFLIRSA